MTGSNLRCTIVCWTLAAIAGITFLAIWVALGLWALVGLGGALVTTLIGGWLLGAVFCSDPRAEAAERQAMFDVAARALGTTSSDTTAPAAAREVADQTRSASEAHRAGSAPSAEERAAKWNRAGTAPTVGAAAAPARHDTPPIGSTPTAPPASAAVDNEAPRAQAAGTTTGADEARPVAGGAATSAVDDGAQQAEDDALSRATGPGASEVEATPDADPAPVADPGAGGTSEVATAATVSGDGTKPAGLDAPRGGTADDLKEIKGVGPKMEQLLNSLGFYHFDQIAGWTADEVAWVDQNLKGFKGRVTRDDWVPQARILAAGGETEFSRKVDQGKVY